MIHRGVVVVNGVFVATDERWVPSRLWPQESGSPVPWELEAQAEHAWGAEGTRVGEVRAVGGRVHGPGRAACAFLHWL